MSQHKHLNKYMQSLSKNFTKTIQNTVLPHSSLQLVLPIYNGENSVFLIVKNYTVAYLQNIINQQGKQ